jgi:integrase
MKTESVDANTDGNNEKAPLGARRRQRGSGEGSVYRRASDGRWVANVSLGYVKGKRRRRVFYGKTRREVVDKLKVALHEQQMGDLPPADRITVAELLDIWLRDTVKPSLTRTTYESYERMTRNHIKPQLGHIRLQNLTQPQVQKLLEALYREGKSARTVLYTRSVLHRALDMARRWGLITRNVSEGVEAPRGRAVRAAKAFTVDEARTLLEYAKGKPLEALYVLTVTYGLRRGEVLGLKWEDVDFDHGTLSVRRSVSRLQDGLRERAVKTEQANRVLPLVGNVPDVLRAHLQRQRRERLRVGPKWRDTGYIFTAPYGGIMEPRNLHYHFKRDLAAAGLGDHRFHDLRHSAATFLIALGVPLPTVAAILGHSSPRITLDVYAHSLETEAGAGIEKMGKLLDGSGAG